MNLPEPPQPPTEETRIAYAMGRKWERQVIVGEIMTEAERVLAIAESMPPTTERAGVVTLARTIKALAVKVAAGGK